MSIYSNKSYKKLIISKKRTFDEIFSDNIEPILDKNNNIDDNNIDNNCKNKIKSDIDDNFVKNQLNLDQFEIKLDKYNECINDYESILNNIKNFQEKISNIINIKNKVDLISIESMSIKKIVSDVKISNIINFKNKVDISEIKTVSVEKIINDKKIVSNIITDKKIISDKKIVYDKKPKNLIDNIKEKLVSLRKQHQVLINEHIARGRKSTSYQKSLFFTSLNKIKNMEKSCKQLVSQN
jgi:hypothetical protein